MRGWRAVGVAAAVSLASLIVVAALLEFLAPDLAYQLKDRSAEMLSGNRGRKFRVALGSKTGSSYRVGTILNRYLLSKAGYELELVATASPGNTGALLDPNQHIDLAAINSADDEAAKADGVYGLAALESQYFFVIVPNDSPIKEFRDLTGPVNPGARGADQPATLGERVLDYYGLTTAAQGAAAAPVSVVRPKLGSNVADFEAGHMVAATRTQFLYGDLIERIFAQGRYRLVPIRDHEALARAIPGTKAGFIPAGLYGPGRRIPAEPVPTLTVTLLLVARRDLPGRVARDILEVIYDPRFARDLQSDLTEEWGRKVAGLPLHPAADIYYHRNDLVTSDRLGRVSFVASGIAAIAAAIQFLTRFRRNEGVRNRRRLLGSELSRLQEIRHRIEESTDPAEMQTLIREADDLLSRAEHDAAAELLDSSAIASLRSVHEGCWRALNNPVAVSASIDIGTRGSAPRRSSGPTLSEVEGSGLGARQGQGGSEPPESSSPSTEGHSARSTPTT
jgi:TRAP-type uncharacterized transport system substrate-binding protein